MLKHQGGCRAAGGEKPPKSEGGGSERQRAGEGSELCEQDKGIFSFYLPKSFMYFWSQIPKLHKMDKQLYLNRTIEEDQPMRYSLCD